MKRIIKNYIVRDPNRLLKNISRKYDFISFSPTIKGQTVFDDPVGLEIGDFRSTELFINGVKYIYEEFYTINERQQLIINNLPPFDVNAKFVLVYR